MFLQLIVIVIIAYFAAQFIEETLLSFAEYLVTPRSKNGGIAPVLHDIQFFGGPFDGIKQQTVRTDQEVVVPFLPEEDEREVVMQRMPDGSEMPFIMPAFALYKLVGDEGQYFFSEQLEKDEAMKWLQEHKEDVE